MLYMGHTLGAIESWSNDGLHEASMTNKFFPLHCYGYLATSFHNMGLENKHH
jgi:hypothetical protein